MNVDPDRLRIGDVVRWTSTDQYYLYTHRRERRFYFVKLTQDDMYPAGPSPFFYGAEIEILDLMLLGRDDDQSTVY